MFFLSVLMSSKLNGNKIWPDTPAGPEVYRYKKISCDICDKEESKLSRATICGIGTNTVAVVEDILRIPPGFAFDNKNVPMIVKKQIKLIGTHQDFTATNCW